MLVFFVVSFCGLKSSGRPFFFVKVDMGHFIGFFRGLFRAPTSQYTASTPTSVVWIFRAIFVGTGMLSLNS